MTGKYADLHNHTFYSDGTMSPIEILESAIQNDVGVLAITDHNELEGTLTLQSLSNGYPIQYISGVELDSLDRGINVHILAYGIDLHNEEFVGFVERNRLLLDRVNSMLIEKMEPDYPNISYSDYLSYHYDRRGGGWKALHYLKERGLTQNLREGFMYYTKYDCTYNKVDFLTVSKVCDYIHRAGGKAILAHPGVTIKETDIQVFEHELRRLMGYGADGIECYYPTHSKELTELCLNICRENDLLITSGSDCHGAFGSAQVGETKTLVNKLNLEGLL